MTTQAPFTLKGRNPDVLTCIANLSNDEVFTPPEVANQILDSLAERWAIDNNGANIWANKSVTFLDPCTKSGVFLREITRRLSEGLSEQIPDVRERVGHILSQQVFGIAITKLTSLLARRSVYCSKNADGQHSIAEGMQNPSGNIYFARFEHSWEGSRCALCNATRSNLEREADIENYAYPFIHMSDIKSSIHSLFGKSMHFDVIVGNPPYQLSDGGAQASATPIYQHFVQQAKSLEPQYLSMIIPSRWFTGGKGLEDFRNAMLNDDQIREIHDFYDASDCFPGVEIKGGVCYFLWKHRSTGDCKVTSYFEGKQDSVTRPLLERGVDAFIRYNGAVRIIEKILRQEEQSMADFISSRKPFGLPTDFRGFSETRFRGAVQIFAHKKVGYVGKEAITRNQPWVSMHKVIAPYAFGSGDSKTDVLKPIYAPPNSCCTETYLVLGAFSTELEANNLIEYTKTAFFRFLLTQLKNTQHATSRVYALVPVQNFKEEWTDQKLYKKYGLSKNDIAVIESAVGSRGLF